MGATPLAINFLQFSPPTRFGDYKTEVEVIAFVERNASWFLIASGSFLAWSALFFRGFGDIIPAADLQGPIFSFLIFEALAILFILPVLLLFWMPNNDPPRELVILRHIKTLPYTYAVGFFAAAVVALISLAKEIPS